MPVATIENFRIDSFDDVLAARIGPADWPSIREFRGRPKLFDLVLHSDRVYSPLFVEHHAFNLMMHEEWRFQILVHAIHLFETRDHANPHSGLTVSNLQKRCLLLDLSSPGRVLQMLQLLRNGGYLRSARSSADKRIVHFEPTPLFARMIDNWQDAINTMVDLADPDARLMARKADYPKIGPEMRRIGTQRLIGGWKPLEAFSEIRMFTARDSGSTLLFHCAAMAIRNRDRTVPIKIGLSEFGKQFGGSRSHLRKMLVDAYDQGLLDAPPVNGAHIVLSERLLCSFFAYVASNYSHYRRCGLQALANLA